MIPLSHLQEWTANAPWPDLRQVEQDLIICRALCDLFNNEKLKGKIAFRGGTIGRYSSNQLTPHITESRHGISLGIANAGRQQRGNVLNETLIQFLQHALFSISTSDRPPFQCKVMAETANQLVAIETKLGESFIQIKQVTVLVALKECPQFGAK